MKALIKFLYGFLIPLAVFGIWSCENRNDDIAGKGKAEFSLSMPEEGAKSSSGFSLDSGIMSYHIMVSIEDMEGNSVISDSLIPVYAFGTGFTSENVELQSGVYNLTKFLVINPSGTVIYAAPIEGSPLAYLVNDPLPLNFSIRADQVTTVAPEVLLVGDQTPGQFGYANFGMQIIKPLGFWTICILDCPMCMSPTQLTTAKLTVYANNGWHYSFKLEPAVNHLIIRGGSEIYYFVLEKEGYLPQKLQFTAKQLIETTKENPLVLKIPWDSNQWKTLVLQPGPEDGKDAMISNLDADKNFGGYKYFEATFISEPVLTVMRSNRSLIWFDRNSLPKSAIIRKVTLQLWYDLPVPFDPIYINDTDPSTGLARYGGVLQQIIEPWEEDKVTWNTQPKTIEANQVFISPFNLNVNFITVDVTRLFVPVNEIAAPNYGMFFKLWPTEKFPGFRFASSDFPEATMRPKLTIYYTIN
jgi:hypothetical protein